jgi:hypothetical protein
LMPTLARQRDSSTVNSPSGSATAQRYFAERSAAHVTSEEAYSRLA